MHLLDHYSLSCGLKSSKPFITEDFFPNPYEKYICINNESSIDSLKYSFWSDVIEMILPDLQANGIEIIQIGKATDESIPSCKNFRNISSRHQAAYLIKRSMLFIGADTFYSALADGLGVRSVLLFGAIPDTCIGPYWHPENATVLCEQEKEKFSFSASESDKSIDKIKPEQIAREILIQLGIEMTKINQNTLNTGSLYKQKILECIPNFSPPLDFAKGSSITTRLDLHFDLNNLINWCDGRKINLVTNKEIPINVLSTIKNNVSIIHYEINESTNSEYLNLIKKLGLPIKLFRTTEEDINSFRLKFFDWGVEFLPKPKKPETLDITSTKDVQFQSGKLVFCNGKKYPSIFHATKEIDSEGIYHKVFDEEEFWEDVDHFRIFEISS